MAPRGRVQRDDRRRLPGAQDGHQGQEGQAEHMGHGGPGALPDDYVLVLPRRAGHHPRVRRREPRVVRGAAQVVLRARDIRLRLGREDHRREQGRQGVLAPSALRRGRGVREAHGRALRRGVREDRRRRAGRVPRRRRPHPRHARALAGRAPPLRHRRRRRGPRSGQRRHAREHRPPAGAGRGRGRRRVRVLSAVAYSADPHLAGDSDGRMVHLNMTCDDDSDGLGWYHGVLSGPSLLWAFPL